MRAKKQSKQEIPENHYQVCIVTLSDGQVARFTGPAFAAPGDTRTIRGIEFTEPKPLPAGHTFGEINKISK